MTYYSNGNGGFLSQIPPVTKNLVFINIIMFIATMINQDFMIETFALFYPSSPFFHPWQIITHMFMHGGFWHIFFNMYTLVMFGTVLERAIGSKKFAVFYFVTGLGAVFLHQGVQFMQIHVMDQGNLQMYYSVVADILRTPTVGASGAIYGVLIGYALLYPESVLMLIFPPIPLKAKWMVLIFVAIELLTGVTGTADGVAHFAHLGGMLFGWLLLLWWRKSGSLYRQDKWF